MEAKVNCARVSSCAEKHSTARSGRILLDKSIKHKQFNSRRLDLKSHALDYLAPPGPLGSTLFCICAFFTVPAVPT